MSAGAPLIRSVAGRWAVHRKVLEQAGVPRAHVAAAMLQYYAGFADALAAALDISGLPDEATGAKLLDALWRECQAFTAMAVAADNALRPERPN